ncbi:MAG: hypothetical protein ACYTEI_11865 [Planctomycetota bacterium]
MPTRRAAQPLALPRGWTRIVNSAVLHALSIAATTQTAAWGRAAGRRGSQCKERAEADRLRSEIALRGEESAIKDARWRRQCRCAKPAAPVKGRCGVHLALVLGHVEDRKHLPVVELRRAA